MITITNLTDLLMAHLRGELSPTEQDQLNHWLSTSERNQRLFASIDNETQLQQLMLAYSQEQEADNEGIILAKIRQSMQAGVATAPVHHLRPRPWLWMAAATLLLAGVGTYWLLHNRSTPAPVVATTPVDIPPGRDGAILTLADGRKVVLDSLGNGVIATESGAAVLLQNGAISYTGNAAANETVWNNLTTPKGRQFQLILPDGTKAWLNAASSLRYPIAFAGTERRVEVAGEVYFEVAPNKNMPFRVNVQAAAGAAGNNGINIEVLGTQFNINAYANEATVKTTLVEGRLKLNAANAQAAVLKAGQQAQIKNNTATAIQIANDADVDKAVAWKNGLFNFEDASLEEVMRQIERWYDIEVVYEKGIPDIRFGGKLSNDVSLNGLLKSLKDSEVSFRLEGRKLIVLP